MAEVKSLYDLGALRPPTSAVCLVAQVEEAIRDLTRDETVVLSYEDKEQEIKVALHSIASMTED